MSTDWSKGMYQRTIELKELNKNLKVMIAVGGKHLIYYYLTMILVISIWMKAGTMAQCPSQKWSATITPAQILSRKRSNFCANIDSTAWVNSNLVCLLSQSMFNNKLTFLDLDWEYPANRDSENRPEDKALFTVLCQVNHLNILVLKSLINKPDSFGRS